jgi:hypothetical protein
MNLDGVGSDHNFILFARRRIERTRACVRFVRRRCKRMKLWSDPYWRMRREKLLSAAKRIARSFTL